MQVGLYQIGIRSLVATVQRRQSHPSDYIKLELEVQSQLLSLPALFLVIISNWNQKSSRNLDAWRNENDKLYQIGIRSLVATYSSNFIIFASLYQIGIRSLVATIWVWIYFLELLYQIGIRSLVATDCRQNSQTLNYIKLELEVQSQLSVAVTLVEPIISNWNQKSSRNFGEVP